MTNNSGAQVAAEPSAKRVRTYLGGRLVADTRHPVLVWEHPYYPTYYIPAEDVRAELRATGETRLTDGLGDGEVYDVLVDGTTAEGAAVRFTDSTALRDLVRLSWSAMDQWFEEDEPVYVHPRDPYKRVDILPSSRHVVVRIGGVVVADSRHPHILFETGLPPRYYLPLTDVRMDLLRPSGRQTQCPYKGTATYWHVLVDGTEHSDIVWTYPTPLPESQKIAGLACFYDEHVEITIDGQRQQPPQTPFS
ncbi:DUF427 domain-containing protein [Saccharopolyspora sp. 5N708]|uniref:DUF427 domain-containing protein n=1 Tax=Saccharopolyspora sp. 5N708 TaxID=3457424 RepID=UPI003FD65698